MQTYHIKAHYFSGQSPLPVTGELMAAPSFLLFHYNDGDERKEIRIAYKQIKSLELQQQACRLEFSLSSGEIPRVIYFPPSIGKKSASSRQNVDSEKSTSSEQSTGSEKSEETVAIETIRKLYDYIYSRRQATGSLFSGSIFLRFLHLPLSQKLLLVILLLSFAAGFYYLLLFYSYHLLPSRIDVSLGELAEKHLLQDGELSICNHKELQDFVQREVTALKPQGSPFHYDVRIIKNPDSNAIALPGGKLVVHSGLIRNSQSPQEVVGILAHEIAHVELRHGLRQVIRNFGVFIFVSLIVGVGFEGLGQAELLTEILHTLVFLHYSRGFESEADRRALQLLQTRGVSPHGLYQFFARLEKERAAVLPYLSTHPDPEDRKNFFLNEMQRQKRREKNATQGDRPGDFTRPTQRVSLPSAVAWKRLKLKCP